MFLFALVYCYSFRPRQIELENEGSFNEAQVVSAFLSLRERIWCCAFVFGSDIIFCVLLTEAGGGPGGNGGRVLPMAGPAEMSLCWFAVTFVLDENMKALP